MSRVGVTGHRILMELDKIAAGVDVALDRIEWAFPGQPLTAISALAEGADRLVAHRVLARPGSRLVVPLPLPKADYVQDFETAESRQEFERLFERADDVVELPAAPGREAAYEAAGNYLLDHCDVLLAVWDGQAEQGQGGTAGVVTRARRRDLPIAWVHAGNRHPNTGEPTSLGPEQGYVTFERFPSPD